MKLIISTLYYLVSTSISPHFLLLKTFEETNRADHCLAYWDQSGKWSLSLLLWENPSLPLSFHVWALQPPEVAGLVWRSLEGSLRHFINIGYRIGARCSEYYPADLILLTILHIQQVELRPLVATPSVLWSSMRDQTRSGYLQQTWQNFVRN